MEALVLRSLRLSVESWRLDLVRWRARAESRMRMRAAQRELEGMGQHELNDLGVGRSELPYWLDDPSSESRLTSDRTPKHLMGRDRLSRSW